MMPTPSPSAVLTAVLITAPRLTQANAAA
jgi:hypothetical protein